MGTNVAGQGLSGKVFTGRSANSLGASSPKPYGHFAANYPSAFRRAPPPLIGVEFSREQHHIIVFDIARVESYDLPDTRHTSQGVRGDPRPGSAALEREGLPRRSVEAYLDEQLDIEIDPRTLKRGLSYPKSFPERKQRRSVSNFFLWPGDWDLPVRASSLLSGWQNTWSNR